MAAFKEQHVAGVAGLIGIRSGGNYYAGKVDREAAIAYGDATDWLDHWDAGNYFQALALSDGYVPLRDAYQLIIQFKPQGDKTEMICMPMPVPPFGGPTKIVVRADVVVDLSREEGLVDVNRMITGHSGVLVPGHRISG